MTNLTAYSLATAYLPILSSQNQGWDNIVVEQFQPPPGEATCQYQDEHAIYLSLAPRPIPLWQTQGHKTYRGLFGKGDISITPANVSLKAQWDDWDRCLQLRINSGFVQQVAREVMGQDSDRLALIPEFRTRDSQIEAIALMLLAELQQNNLGEKLYIESLVNLLAVRLLRQYATAKPHLPIYEGGLSQYQLSLILDYIHEYLDQPLKLADLAALLGISLFHFSHLFKQSLGIAPYQYLLQQRVERAKQLLKQTDQSIAEIAFACGFNSHSHLSKQFRQLTGVTPKSYRLSDRTIKHE